MSLILATRRHRIALMAGLLLSGPAVARADPQGTIAGELKTTEAQTRRRDAAMAGMTLVPAHREKAAAKRTDGKRTVASTRAAIAIPATPQPAAEHPLTAGKPFQVGPVTITPGGFLSVDGVSR